MTGHGDPDGLGFETNAIHGGGAADTATGAVNTPGFGTTTDKQGHRIIQAAVKFYF